jgi:diaminopimelate epimerase
MQVLKGHGTENDFVLVPDLDGALTLTAELTRALTDRHAGIGADGVLRVVRSAKDPDGVAMAGQAEFFMDYRNADGSIAEMCGNGVRVFAQFLRQHGLLETAAATHTSIATRGGVKDVWFESDGQITVGMGRPEFLPAAPSVAVAGVALSEAGATVEMPNPHVVVWLDNAEQLAALDLTHAPDVVPSRPDGQNVEFAVRLGPRHIAMRVHERGVGETRSCGTGICAVVATVRDSDSGRAEAGSPWLVDVPGGRCEVSWTAEGDARLRGPATLVAAIELDDNWLGRATANEGRSSSA